MKKSVQVSILLIAVAVAVCNGSQGAQSNSSSTTNAIGTAVYVDSAANKYLRDAPSVKLVFLGRDGREESVLTDERGDYVISLAAEHYCLAAYSVQGNAIQLAPNQLKCFSIRKNQSFRLDVMLEDRK